MGDHGFPPQTEGTQRTLSAYNLFVRAMLQKLKEGHPDLPQGEHLKKVGEMWRNMSKTERAKWRADGEEGSRVPGSSTFFAPKTPTKPSSYQMFVKGMTAELRQSHPDNKQSDNMRKIGELWRDMSAEERAKWRCDDEQLNQHGMMMDGKDGSTRAARRRARKGGKDEVPPNAGQFGGPPHMFGGGMAGYPGSGMMPSGYPDPSAAGGYGAFAAGQRGGAGAAAGQAGRYGQQAVSGAYGMPGMYGQAGAAGATPYGGAVPASPYGASYGGAQGYSFDPYGGGMPGGYGQAAQQNRFHPYSSGR